MQVKPPLSGHRARQALATREQVARSARVLFRELGYVATTMQAIAQAAAVPEPTIYSALGSKAGILAEIRRLWIADSDVRRQHDQALVQLDPVRRLRMAAHWHRRQMELGYDIIAIYQEAARADPSMAQEWQRVQASREGAVRELVASLEGRLAPGLTLTTATDVYLTCTLAEVYRTLVLERGWSLAHYEHWLAGLLVRQLLAQP